MYSIYDYVLLKSEAFDEELVVLKELEGFINMLYMGIPSFSINKNVIEESQNKIMKICTQKFIHEAFDISG